jgi:hypothetical protein
MMRGMEALGPCVAGAERVCDRTYCGDRGGVGAGFGSMMEMTREERCEWERETGREVEARATIMRSLPCWETGWMTTRRGGEGISSSCSTFTVVRREG